MTRASLEKEEEYILWMILPERIKRESFPTTVEKRGCWVSIDVSPFVLKKQTNKAGEKKAKKRTLRKERRGQKKAQQKL